MRKTYMKPSMDTHASAMVQIICQSPKATQVDGNVFDGQITPGGDEPARSRKRGIWDGMDE